MVIQRRSQRSLKEVIEGQPGRVVEKQVQVQPPSLPPPPPQSSQPTVNEPSEPKRRREPKGKEVMGVGRTPTTSEGEDQRAAKQQKTSHGTQREAVQATFRLEEIAKSYYDQIDDEKKKRISAVRTLNASEQNIAQLKKKLAAEEEARKSADSALEGFQRQAEDQGRLLRDANAQLATSKEQEALDRAGVESYSELRKLENIYFPPAIRASTPSTPIGEVPVIVAEPLEKVQTQALPTLSQQELLLAPGKEKGLSSAKEIAGLKDGAASHTFEQALASTTRPVEDAPQEVASKAPPKLQIKLTK
nr:mediator of RNA polymerase II transcription subunit 15-like [Quercus suber]